MALMSDQYDPDEEFSLWPLDPETGLRRLLGAEMDEDTEDVEEEDS